MNKEQQARVTIFEQRTTQQLAVDLVTLQDQRDALATQLAEARAETRKYKLAGVGMAASMGEHVCVPEGWQLVPAKPTAKMVEICDNKYSGISRPPAGAIYRTMLAAAPKPRVTK